jgi:hypothetical protein
MTEDEAWKTIKDALKTEIVRIEQRAYDRGVAVMKAQSERKQITLKECGRRVSVLLMASLRGAGVELDEINQYAEYLSERVLKQAKQSACAAPEQEEHPILRTLRFISEQKPTSAGCCMFTEHAVLTWAMLHEYRKEWEAKHQERMGAR